MRIVRSSLSLALAVDEIPSENFMQMDEIPEDPNCGVITMKGE